MAKYQKSVPAKAGSNLTTLGARFDEQGNPTEVKWFTEKGFNLIPDDLNYNKQGGKTRVKNGGWVRVRPEDFEPAPAPLTADQVTGQPVKAVANPNEVVVTTGADIKKTDDGEDKSGNPDKGGDQDQTKSEAKETAKADSKAGSKK